MVGWLAIIGGVANVMEVITFIQFIEEEAIQSASLGVFLSVRAKSYKGASLGITLLIGQLIPHLKLINTEIGWLAPYSKQCFSDFIDATETNIEIYKHILGVHRT